MPNQVKFQDVVVNVGDKVKVYQKIKEGEKFRNQIFEGVVIAIKSHGRGESISVRKIGPGGIGVERIWPLLTPWIDKIKVVGRGKARRAKLYYLRRGTLSKIKTEKDVESKESRPDRGKTGKELPDKKPLPDTSA